MAFMVKLDTCVLFYYISIVLFNILSHSLSICFSINLTNRLIYLSFYPSSILLSFFQTFSLTNLLSISLTNVWLSISLTIYLSRYPWITRRSGRRRTCSLQEAQNLWFCWQKQSYPQICQEGYPRYLSV